MQLYSTQTDLAVSRRLNRRLAVLFIVTGLLLAVFVWAVITRTEWLAMASACVAGCFAIFFADLFCAPLYRYRRLVRSAVSGRSHSRTLEFARLEPDISVVDGVPCRSLIFLGDPDKHGSRDMLLYWDNEMQLPVMEAGAFYAVEYTGKNIIGLQPAEAPSSRP